MEHGNLLIHTTCVRRLWTVRSPNPQNCTRESQLTLSQAGLEWRRERHGERDAGVEVRAAANQRGRTEQRDSASWLKQWQRRRRRG